MKKGRQLRSGMRHSLARTLMAVAAAAGLSLSPAATASASPAPAFVPGQVVVRYVPGTSGAERHELRGEVGGLEQRIALPRAELLDLAPGVSVRNAVAQLEEMPQVAYAEPNFIYHPAFTPNDPLFGQQWGLRNIGQLINGSGGSTLDADIDAQPAWDTTTGLGSVVIAVVDTGLASTHEDLDGNLWTNPDDPTFDDDDDDDNGLEDDVSGWDFVDDDELPTDLDGHGTHVAGILGAEGDNGIGVAGVNWDVSLMALRACSLNSCTNADMTSAFTYAGAHGADAVNASISGPVLSSSQEAAFQSAPNTLFVVAAGNDSTDNDEIARGPCNSTAPNVICVAASGRADELADFSNFGGSSVDLAAPGVSIDSTYPYIDRASVSFGSTANPPIGPGWTRDGHPNTWERTTEDTQLSNSTLTDSEGGDYANNADNWATFGPVDLSDDTGCHLHYELERALGLGDFIRVETSVDDDSYSTIDSAAGVVGKDIRAVDLSSVSGEPEVWIRFHLEALGTGTGDGVHIDNVKIRCPQPDLYSYIGGTSMASPHVAGAAGLLIAQAPSASVATVRGWLLDGVDVKASLDGLVATEGRLNLNRSMSGALGADIHRPQTSISSGPTSAGTRGPATFHFEADEAASFRCSLDGATSSPCTSPVTFNGLSIGPHDFNVFATDSSGNSDRSAAGRDFSIARTARCRKLKRKLRRASTPARKRALRPRVRRACRTF